MALNYRPGRIEDADREKLGKQIFKDVQTLIRYIDQRKGKESAHSSVIASYERMVQERCDLLGNLEKV